MWIRFKDSTFLYFVNLEITPHAFSYYNLILNTNELLLYVAVTE